MTLLLLVVACAFAKPKVRIIATGGTIAGAGTSATGSAYTAGQVGVQSLIAAVPQMLASFILLLFFRKSQLP